MLKKILLGIGGLLALAIVGIVGKFYLAAPDMRDAEDLTAPTDEASIARGKYLATNVLVCLGCHSEVREDVPGEPVVEGRLGSGRQFPVMAGLPGVIRTPNLTPFHLGDWTDGEIVRAMREGVSRDGRPLFPMMPYKVYGKHLSKEDALAVVAYLRTLEPVENDPGPTEIDFPVSMFMRAEPHPVEQEPAAAPSSDLDAYGDWLLAVCSCAECHTTVDDKHQQIPGFDYAGGVPFPHGQQMINSSNITPHATGIEAYTEEELERAIFQGKARDGRDLLIMPWLWYGGMQPEERKALMHAVQNITPVDHKVERIAGGG